MKKSVKYLLIILGAFMIAWSANTLYILTLYKSDIQYYAHTWLKLKENIDNTQVLYLGDCSNRTTSDADQSQKSINEIIESAFPKWKMTSISHDGYHAQMYRALLNGAKDAKALETVVVTLNLRTFSAYSLWSDYHNSFSQSLVFMNDHPPLWNRMRLSLGLYEQLSREAYQEAMNASWEAETLAFPYPFEYKTTADWNKGISNGGFKNPDGSWDQERIENASFIIKDFALHIDSLHPLIKSLDEMIEMAEQGGFQIIFNLLPENTSYIKQILGPDILYLIEQNRGYLVNRYNTRNSSVIDNLDLLSVDEFIEENPNEHYTFHGREKIAQTLIKELDKTYPWEAEGYETKGYDVVNASSMDMEGPFWTNFSSIQNEFSHAGQFSSKLQADNPYSPTFILPMTADLASSAFSLAIEFYCYSKLPSENYKLVIERQMSDGQTSWFSSNVQDATTLESSVWQRIQQIISIGEDTPNDAKIQLIKVYLLNEHSEPVFVDDLRIEVRR